MPAKYPPTLRALVSELEITIDAAATDATSPVEIERLAGVLHACALAAAARASAVKAHFDGDTERAATFETGADQYLTNAARLCSLGHEPGRDIVG